jgi:hypothetical protein
MAHKAQQDPKAQRGIKAIRVFPVSGVQLAPKDQKVIRENQEKEVQKAQWACPDWTD